MKFDINMHLIKGYYLKHTKANVNLIVKEKTIKDNL